MTLPPALGSRSRNGELLLLSGSVAFLLLAWRALDAAGFAMPSSSGRILAQFVVSAAAGHVALRLVAPRAAAQPYAIALMLCAVGLAFITRLVPSVAVSQANWVTLGIVLMVVSAAAGQRYRLLRRYRYTAALVALAILVATGLFGTTINGARLWFRIAGQNVQSTELIKLFLVVFLAGYLADFGGALAAPRLRLGARTYSALPYVVPLVLTLLVAMAMIALLKDLGQIVLLIVLSMAMLYVATGRTVFIVGGFVLLGLSLVFGYFAFDHARTRIDVWLDPYADASGAGYQSLQAMYAIEAGGVTGEGLGVGDPEAIPIVSTDYIFSAIAEELGLAGAAGVLLLYLLLLVASFRVALSAPDDFGRLLATCIGLLLAIQAAVIVGGNLRLIPTTGITLPFVSYGGSSLVVNFALLGLLIGISNQASSNQG